MLINGFTEDKNIIYVDNAEFTKMIENVIHDILELTRGIFLIQKALHSTHNDQKGW